MPPEGKVGVSPVCILGVNINKGASDMTHMRVLFRGTCEVSSVLCRAAVHLDSATAAGQEISLRLRTDDLKGFRRYDRIRETLIHELAHMVWGEHDANFKELNSQVRDIADRAPYQQHTADHKLRGYFYDTCEGAPQRVFGTCSC